MPGDTERGGNIGWENDESSGTQQQQQRQRILLSCLIV